VADSMSERGLAVKLCHASDVRDVTAHEAVVIGSALYYGHWLAPAHGLVAQLGAQLRLRPVWVFSSGRINGRPEVDIDPAHVDWILAQSGAREHMSFAGRLAEGEELNWRERTATRAVHARSGDHRDWAQIAAWATAIAEWLQTGQRDAAEISGPMALPDA